jgi:hypothetical protein
LEKILGGLANGGLNSDDFKSDLGDLYEKYTVATWNLGNISAFGWRQTEAKKTCVEMADRRNFRINTDLYPVVPQIEIMRVH